MSAGEHIPPIFKKLGPKDRSHLLANIRHENEQQKPPQPTTNMSSEQTYANGLNDLIMPMSLSITDALSIRQLHRHQA
jgi:hypothetical protein